MQAHRCSHPNASCVFDTMRRNMLRYTRRYVHMSYNCMSYCQCEFTQNPRAEPRQRRVGRRRGGRGRSRRSGSGSDYDQWKLSVKSENHTPSSAKRRSSKRPPNLTNLGRASDETVVLHMAKYRSRTLRVTANRLSNVQGQTRRFRPQCANRRFVRFVSAINELKGAAVGTKIAEHIA